MKLSVIFLSITSLITLAKSPACINCLKGFPVPNKFNVLSESLIFLRSAVIKCIFIPFSKLSNSLYRLQGNRHGCISNIIFSRDSFERENGFVNFPFGWYADDASILAFAGDKEIYTISGPRIKYRISWGKNVSSQKSFRKIDALFQYRDWLNDRFINTSYPELGLNIDMINKTAKKWFLNNIIILEGMPYLKILSVSRKLNNIYHNGIIKNFILLILLNLFTSFIGSLKLLKKYLIAT